MRRIMRRISGGAREAIGPWPAQMWARVPERLGGENLHVVLRERVVRIPPERLGEILRADRTRVVLQPVEDPLQRQRDALRADLRAATAQW